MGRKKGQEARASPTPRKIMDNKSCSFCLIDEDGIVNVDGIDSFVKKVKLNDSETSCAKVSIMGPQSSGKSTLLNHLFGTNFTEMDAYSTRGQTTKGIWLANCPLIERCTLVMDLEGFDGKERGEDDTSFEKKTALFALAISDVVIINMWCNDLGRVRGASQPLLKTIFEVMGQKFGYRKTTLLFTLRDKTKSSIKMLESLVWKDIHRIWESVDKPGAEKETPIREIFNVEIIALPSYENKEDQFKEEVANLRQKIVKLITLGDLVKEKGGIIPTLGKILEDDDNLVPYLGFSHSVQQIWDTIKECKDLNLPSDKVMQDTVRCEEICNQEFNSFVENEDWNRLKTDVQMKHVPDFGNRLTSILDTCRSKYDVGVAYFDEGIRTEKRRELNDRLLQVVLPAYESMMERIHHQTLEKFKESFYKRLKPEFSFAACDYTKSFMTQFDELLSESAIQQEISGDSVKRHDKLQEDINSHVDNIRHSKEIELFNHYEAKLEAKLSRPVEILLERAGDDTWKEIRQLFWSKFRSQNKKFSIALSDLNTEVKTKKKMLEELEDSARKLIHEKTKLEADRVDINMKERFERFFTHDSNSLRVWNGEEDIEAISRTAYSASLKLLSIMAVVCLDEDADIIKKTLSLALVDNQRTTTLDPLDSETWEKVPLQRTLITPQKCKSIWRKFRTNSQPFVSEIQAISSSIIEVYDKHGKIISDKNKFKDRCLALCKDQIRVGFYDWKEVPDSRKDVIWEILQEQFQLEPNQKNNVLKQMWVQWKTWRDKALKEYEDFILACTNKVPQEGRIISKEAYNFNVHCVQETEENVHNRFYPSGDATKGKQAAISSGHSQTSPNFKDIGKPKKMNVWNVKGHHGGRNEDKLNQDSIKSMTKHLKKSISHYHKLKNLKIGNFEQSVNDLIILCQGLEEEKTGHVSFGSQSPHSPKDYAAL